MSNLVRIIVVDDSIDDCTLIAHELKKAFPRVEVEQIGKPDALARALESSADLVITDYQLCWTNGLDVLKLSKQQHPDRPVIMFTGTGSEEIAIEAMRSGVDDYVLKSTRHYVHLIPAVRWAIDRSEARRRAARVELRLQQMLDRLHVGVFRASRTGEILDVNRAFLELTGIGDPTGAFRLADLFCDCSDHQRLQERLDAESEVHGVETRIRRADGSPVWVSLTLKLVPMPDGEVLVDGLIEDAWQRVHAQEKVRQEQRMETVGQIAAGVAHDFNNLLTIIQGYTSMLQSRALDEAQTRHALDHIHGASERAAALTRQLLEFTNRRMLPLNPVNALALSPILKGLTSAVQLPASTPSDDDPNR